MQGDLLITTNEAAEILGIGRKGVLRMIEDGRLKADRIATKGESRLFHYRVRQSEVEALAKDASWRLRAPVGQGKRSRPRPNGTEVAGK